MVNCIFNSYMMDFIELLKICPRDIEKLIYKYWIDVEFQKEHRKKFEKTLIHINNIKREVIECNYDYLPYFYKITYRLTIRVKCKDHKEKDVCCASFSMPILTRGIIKGYYNIHGDILCNC